MSIQSSRHNQALHHGEMSVEQTRKRTQRHAETGG